MASEAGTSGITVFAECAATTHLILNAREFLRTVIVDCVIFQCLLR